MAPATTDAEHDSRDGTNWQDVEQADQDQINRLYEVDPDTGEQVLNSVLREFQDGAIDQTGKADDAIDFEDMSDDDLPDEEEGPASNTADLPGLTDDSGTNDLDDLFGGDIPSSPIADAHDIFPSSPRPLDADGDIDLDDQIRLGPAASPSAEGQQISALEFRRQLEEREAEAALHPKEIPGEKVDKVAAAKAIFPDFDQDKNLFWLDFFKPRSAHWICKKPQKPPKPLIPTKLTLEFDIDQEKLFRIPGPATNSIYQRIKEAESRGLVCLEEPEPIEQDDLEVFGLDDETDAEAVGGLSLRDIATICDDWDAMIALGDTIDTPATVAERNNAQANDGLSEDDDAAWDKMFLDDEEPPAKRRRTEIPQGLPPIPRFTAPNFDNFEQATSKLSKRVILDLNDPYLLIDDVESERVSKRRKISHKPVRLANGKSGRDIAQRFNHSSDAAYDALRENSQNKIRATLAAIPIEHSQPALRLAWPFYQVRLMDDDPHSYHRPTPNLKKEAYRPVKFVKPTILKRKNLKGKRIGDIFKTTHDLSLNDNSTAILFEYCEEIPQVLSNRGMGQKIINYYRRAKGSDSRPEKCELGENCVLLPEDRSPFAIFGQVQPGEVVPTLHNNLFRAPIFKHTPRETDFILGRSTTSQGSSWYLRPIDHLYVVGQTMPSIDIPSPHSRRMTGMVKHRLKMVSYRMIARKGYCGLHEVTRAVEGSTESQNRQKLREFLAYDKEDKVWRIRPGDEEELDEENIRNMVRPEEICCLDGMQIGIRELENMGYDIKALKDGEELDNENPEKTSNDVKMAPWNSTKAFIDASHGKAMLAVHGHGDPTGIGLGISYIRTSMKGGYLEHLQGPLATSADAIEKAKKANGGHLYNVKTQDTLYTEAINKIWTRQRESLNDATVHADDDVAFQEDDDARFDAAQNTQNASGRDDMSQISRARTNDQGPKKKLKITRQVKGPNGEIQTVSEIVHDAGVIAQYVKTRRKIDTENIDIYNAKLTGNAEQDRVILEIAEKEQARLERNRERTKKRDKQKKLQQQVRGSGGGGDMGGLGGFDPMSPEPSIEGGGGGGGGKATGTTRKCANCGQVGHIKTNKKLCPKLNGTLPRDGDGEDGPGGLGSMANAPVAAGFVGLG
ncbi:Protein of unknown function (DUF3591) domain containing protein [Naviculisporaceae sp. PSN 640]